MGTSGDNKNTIKDDKNYYPILKNTGIKLHSIKNKKDILNNCKGLIFWIDKKVYNSENSSYLKSFQKDPIYRQLLTSLQFICFDNLKDALDLILNYINFELIFVIIC